MHVLNIPCLEHVKVGIQEGAQWVGGRPHLSILDSWTIFEDIRMARTDYKF